ncbi:MAG TPA: imelysin family protein [Kofleriaceae bacterium]|nr:imelysin family protein [Kofleriaceae bacterium]
MRKSIFLPLCAVTLALSACSDDDGAGAAFDDREIITDYADRVVIPTYQLLAQRAQALDAAIAALAATPSQASLTAARQAWVATRVPWEQSEAHLFGPVSASGYDPAMDSWPVNRTDLDAVLASGNALTQAYVSALPEEQKGFHTLEYLLWGERSDKPAAALTARELAYARALAVELVTVTGELATSWTAGVRGATPYRTVFVDAGLAGNTAYPSQGAAAQEILGGMSGICDEVANGKIADPYDAHDPQKVESQFSYNSLSDFADNLRGVLNAYTGDAQAAGTTGRGLADFVAARAPELDARLRAELQAAIDAIGAIPAPFRTAITTPASYPVIEAAQAAIRKVQETIDGELTRVVLQ